MRALIIASPSSLTFSGFAWADGISTSSGVLANSVIAPDQSAASGQR
jgi:hypothetical protein